MKVTRINSLVLRGLLATILAICSTGGAHASDLDNAEFDPQFTLKVGRIFFDSIDTSFLSDVDGGALSTNIDFTRDLDIQDSQGSILIEGSYRFDHRHQVDFSLYDLERSGQRRIDRDISFNGEDFAVNTVVESNFNQQTLILTYSYLFYSQDVIDLGLTAGLHKSDMELSLKTPTGSISASTKENLPLPVVGLLLSYDLSDTWTVTYQTRVFLLNYDSFRGDLNDSKLTFEYHASDRWGIEVGINRRSNEMEVKEDRSLTRTKGVALGYLANLVWRF